MTDSAGKGIDGLEAAMAELAGAVEGLQWETAVRLLVGLRAALESCAELPRGGQTGRLRRVEEQMAEAMERLQRERAAIRSELGKLHRDSILVRAYLGAGT